MSSDIPEGQDAPRGRTPRLGDARSPVGSTLSIVLAVVAVVAGFLLIRSLTSDDDGGSADNGDVETEQTTADDGTSASPRTTLVSTGTGGAATDGTATGNSSVLGGATQTTAATQTAAKTGATIAVANASGMGGSAGAMSSALTTAGYEGVGEPGDSDQRLESSVVYYVATDTAAQAVAASIAADLGGVESEAMPATRPASGGITDSATVLVMLGTDMAGKPLATSD